jgi:Flp pilus assembly protein TadD
MLLGELRCRNGKFEKALECYSRVISLYPAAQRPRLFRASVLLRLGRVDDAMHEYGALLEIDKVEKKSTSFFF